MPVRIRSLRRRDSRTNFYLINLISQGCNGDMRPMNERIDSGLESLICKSGGTVYRFRAVIPSSVWFILTQLLGAYNLSWCVLIERLRKWKLFSSVGKKELSSIPLIATAMWAFNPPYSQTGAASYLIPLHLRGRPKGVSSEKVLPPCKWENGTWIVGYRGWFRLDECLVQKNVNVQH